MILLGLSLTLDYDKVNRRLARYSPRARATNQIHFEQNSTKAESEGVTRQGNGQTWAQ